MDSSFNLFPTPVLCCPNFLSDSEREKIFEILIDFDCPHHSSVVGGKSSFYIVNDILHSLNLKKRIQKKINIYTDKHKIRPVEITNSWFNIHHDGGHLVSHDHPTSVVSIALYINVDECGSSLSFYNPNSLMSFSWNPPPIKGFDHSRFDIKPENGDLYIFPSWLRHGSVSFAGTKNRMVISANTKWDKNWIVSYQ